MQGCGGQAPVQGSVSTGSSVTDTRGAALQGSVSTGGDAQVILRNTRGNTDVMTLTCKRTVQYGQRSTPLSAESVPGGDLDLICALSVAYSDDRRPMSQNSVSLGGGNGDLKSRSCALGIAPEVSQES